MQWNTDPKSKWVAVYRIIVLVLLIAQMLLIRRGHTTLETEVKGVQATVVRAR